MMRKSRFKGKKMPFMSFCPISYGSSAMSHEYIVSAVSTNISTVANVIFILHRMELKYTILSVFAVFCPMKIVSDKAAAKTL